MAKHATKKSAETELIEELRQLRQTVNKLPKDFEVIIHPGKHLFLNYMRGIVYGLGALTAVAIVIPVIISLLRHVEWVPLLGDLVTRIILQVESVRTF